MPLSVRRAVRPPGAAAHDAVLGSGSATRGSSIGPTRGRHQPRGRSGRPLRTGAGSVACAGERAADGVEGAQGVLEERRLLRRRASSRASRRRCGYAGSRGPSGRGCPGTAGRRRAHRAGTRTGCGTSRPGKAASAGDSRNAVRTSASTAHAWRSHRAGRRHGLAASRRAPRPPSSSICPNRSRSRAVAASPPSCTAVPRPSQMISASCSAPIGAQTSVADQVAIRAPGGALADPAQHVGLRRAVEEAAAVRAVGPQRAAGTRTARGRSPSGPADPRVQLADLGVRVGVVLAEAHPAAHVEQVPHGGAGVPAAASSGT